MKYTPDNQSKSRALSRTLIFEFIVADPGYEFESFQDPNGRKVLSTSTW